MEEEEELALCDSCPVWSISITGQRKGGEEHQGVLTMINRAKDQSQWLRLISESIPKGKGGSIGQEQTRNWDSKARDTSTGIFSKMILNRRPFRVLIIQLLAKLDYTFCMRLEDVLLHVVGVLCLRQYMVFLNYLSCIQHPLFWKTNMGLICRPDISLNRLFCRGENVLIRGNTGSF